MASVAVPIAADWVRAPERSPAVKPVSRCSRRDITYTAASPASVTTRVSISGRTPSCFRARMNWGPAEYPLPNRKSRKATVFTAGEMSISSCPMKSPANSDPVTSPSAWPPTFTLPIT